MKKLYSLFLVISSVVTTNLVIAQWTDDTSINTLVTDSAHFKSNASFIVDGNGGYFVVYSEGHSFPNSDDIYAQHIDADGYKLWDAAGVLVCSEDYVQTRSVVCLDGIGGIFIAWTDNRDSAKNGGDGSNNYKPAMAHLDENGTVLWSIVVDDDANYNFATQPFPIDMEGDGAGGVFVCWNNPILLQQIDVFMQRVDVDGNMLWAEKLNLAPIATSQYNSQLVSNGNGGCFIGWMDDRNNSYDFYMQNVDALGNILWEPNGAPIIDELANSNFEYLLKSDGQNGLYLTYLRRMGGSAETDLYAQRIDPSGEELWGDNGLSVCSASGYQTIHTTSIDTNYNLLCVWEDHRETENNFTDVYSQKIDSAGQVQWTVDGVLTLEGEFASVQTPDITTDGQGGVIVSGANSNLTGNNLDQIVLSNITSAGILNGEYKFASSSSALLKADNRLLSTVEGECISLWKEDRFGEVHRLYFQKTSFELYSELPPEAELLSLRIWPNPCIEKLFIDIPSNYASIRIINTFGEVVLTTENTNEIDVSFLAPGCYFVSGGQIQKLFVKV